MATQREKETVFAVPEFWVYAYDPTHGYDGHLYAHARLTPKQASAELAYRAQAGKLRRHLPYITVRRATWRDREYIDAVLTKPPVWADCPWWQDNAAIHADHCVRSSAEKPGMLAYFQSAEKAAIGLRTQIRPGRYLSRFFADILPESERAKMARWQETGSLENDFANPAKYPLAFARTRDEIIEVYDTGPESCMTSKSDEPWESATHPCEVYAAGDLAIAYLYSANEDNAVKARALCWPERKIFGRVYPTPGNWSSDGYSSPDESEAMQSALTNRLLADGWKVSSRCGQSSFEGARLLKIAIDKDKYKYVMPYLDWDWAIDDCGSYFHMTRNGTAAQQAEGYVFLEDDRRSCDHCGRGMDDDESYTVYTHVDTNGGRGEELWCIYCYESHSFNCEGFDETFADYVDHLEVDGSTYTRRYAEENFQYSNYSSEYFDDEAVAMADGDVWSQDEFDEHGFICAITSDNYALTERHPDHPEIWDGCDPDDIAAWLADRRIDDPSQMELATQGEST